MWPFGPHPGRAGHPAIGGYERARRLDGSWGGLADRQEPVAEGAMLGRRGGVHRFELLDRMARAQIQLRTHACATDRVVGSKRRRTQPHCDDDEHDLGGKAEAEPRRASHGPTVPPPPGAVNPRSRGGSEEPHRVGRPDPDAHLGR